MTAPTTQEKTTTVKVGDRGAAVSPLRPAGRVKFGDNIVDCVSEAAFLEKGAEAQIIKVQGNRVVVKPVKEQE